jgi:hypothetical protein
MGASAVQYGYSEWVDPGQESPSPVTYAIARTATSWRLTIALLGFRCWLELGWQS